MSPSAARMDEAAKKRVLRLVPYGLYVVGARERKVENLEKDLNAFIGSWVTQTSFDPPMVVACVKRDSRSRVMIRDAGVFTLNLLGAGQKGLATRFLKKTMEIRVAEGGANGVAGDVEGVPFRVEEQTGCPVFPDLPGWVACKVVHAYEGENDHTVFVARIVDAGFNGPEDAAPLSHEETGWTYAG